MSRSTVCASVNNHGQPLRWKFTEPLGSCVYSVYDELSFIFGWMSVFAWTFALLPQIVTNFINQSAESQSFWFWLLWLLGDVCNLTGCLLTDNLITNIALAIVYLGFTAIAFFQYVYYEYCLPKVKNAAILQPHGMATDSIHVMYQSPSQRTQLVKQDMSPTLRMALKIAHESPRMFNVDMNLAPEARLELNNLLAHQEELTNNTKSTKRSLRTQKTIQSNDGRTVMTRLVVPSQLNDKRQINSDILTSVKPYDLFDAPRASSADVVYPGPHLNVNESSPSTTAQFQLPSPALQGVPALSIGSSEPHLPLQHKEIHIIPRAHIQDSHDGDMKESSQQSIKRTTPKNGVLLSIGTIFLWLNYITVTTEEESSSQSQSQPHSQPQHTHSLSITSKDLGLILGWVCTAIYVSSRIPQLKLMLTTKKVDGLNPLFFFLTLSGNLTQFASMLVMPDTYHDMAVFIKMLPWLISSGLCMLQDLSILCLVFWYKNKSKYPPLKTIRHENYNSLDTTAIKGET